MEDVVNGINERENSVGFMNSLLIGFKGRISKIMKLFVLIITAVLIIAYLMFTFFPISSLITFSSVNGIATSLLNTDALSSITLSFITTSITAAMCFIFGTPVAIMLARKRKNRFVKICAVICKLPIALPPSVAGIALILFFGNSGIFGNFLVSHGITIFFTSIAVVIAQFFVSCPLYIQVVKTAIAGVPEELFEVGLVNGADEIQTITFFILPMIKNSILTGISVSFIRALGEFGATLMFAGNMTGKTATMPLYIYTLMQKDIGLATSFSLILLITAAIVLLLIRIVFCREE